MRSSTPPTPPSPSAAVKPGNSRQTSSFGCSDVFATLKKLFSKKAFIIILVTTSTAMAYNNTLSVKIEQIMCAKGYSDQQAGLAGSIIILVGFCASFPIGFLAYKTEKGVLISKIGSCLAIGAVWMVTYYIRLPGSQTGIFLGCALMGVTAAGCYPLLLELIGEFKVKQLQYF